MERDCESTKALRRVEVLGALEAMRHYVLQKVDGLHSEMAKRIEERRCVVDGIVSSIAAVDPKSDKVLTLAQFEEYERLQRQLVDTLKEISVSKEIQEEFLSMLADGEKFFVPDRFYVLASHQPLPKLQESRPEDVAGPWRVYRCTRMENCLKAVEKYIRGKLEKLCSNMGRSETTVVEVVSEILAVAEKVGSSLTIDQFEEYVALHRTLVGESKDVLGAEERARGEFEAMIRESKRMVVPEGKYHAFVTEPFREEQSVEQPECPEVYIIGSYIFLLLAFAASMFVY